MHADSTEFMDTLSLLFVLETNNLISYGWFYTVLRFKNKNKKVLNQLVVSQ